MKTAIKRLFVDNTIEIPVRDLSVTASDPAEVDRWYREERHRVEKLLDEWGRSPKSITPTQNRSLK